MLLIITFCRCNYLLDADDRPQFNHPSHPFNQPHSIFSQSRYNFNEAIQVYGKKTSW